LLPSLRETTRSPANSGTRAAFTPRPIGVEERFDKSVKRKRETANNGIVVGTFFQRRISAVARSPHGRPVRRNKEYLFGVPGEHRDGFSMTRLSRYTSGWLIPAGIPNRNISAT